MDESEKNSLGVSISKRNIAVGFISLLVLLVAGFTLFGGGAAGTVVATVNGEPITTGDVEGIMQSSMMQGQEITEEDAIEQAITFEVISQEAENEGYLPTIQETEQELESQLVMQGMTLDDFKEQAEMQGSSYEEEINFYREQFAIQNYLDSVLGDQIPEITDEDVREFYDFYSEQSQGEGVPPFEEVEPQIRMVLEQEAQQELIGFLIQQLLESAEIEYYI